MSETIITKGYKPVPSIIPETVILIIDAEIVATVEEKEEEINTVPLLMKAVAT